MNRLLLFLPHDSSYCRAERQRKRLRETLESIDKVIGDEVLEFHLPSTAAISDDGADEISIWLAIHPASVGIGADIPAHVIGELREIGNILLNAACKLEASKGGAV